MNTPHSDELRDNLVEAGQNLREAAIKAMPAAREQINRASDSMAAQAESLEDSITARIREKPISSILIAAAVGMFAGLFFLRR